MFTNALKISVGALALLALKVDAACDNACSGHGTCGADDVCACYPNFRMGDEDGGDCSDRVCPYEVAWVDHPGKDGSFHNYAECAGRGICDRELGQCECFEGYTGKACQRTTCPNDCNGHGTCEYIEELGFYSTFGDYYNGASNYKAFGQRAVTFGSADIWDNHKTMGCVCDPRWTGLDCSRRMCPKGNDVLNTRLDTSDTLLYQVQTISFVTTAAGGAAGATYTDLAGKSFALTFISTLNETYTTVPIKIDTTEADGSTSCDSSGTLTANCADLVASTVQAALLNLPHKVIDGVTVTASSPTATDLTLQVTFTGSAVQGPQNLIQVEDFACDAGCTPKIANGETTMLHDSTSSASYVTQTTAADYNNYECGRRGKCDYETGLCECFDGYTGESCSTQTALI
jgi:hypothetical protein